MSKALSYTKWDSIGDSDDEAADDAQSQSPAAVRRNHHHHDSLMRVFQNACEMKAAAEVEYERGEVAEEGGQAECYEKATSVYEDCMREIVAGSNGEIADANYYDDDKNETVVALREIYRTCELNAIACSLKQSKWQHVITACKRLLRSSKQAEAFQNRSILRVRLLYFISSAYMNLSGAENGLREAAIYSKELYTLLKDMENYGSFTGSDDLAQYNRLFDEVMQRNERAALANADLRVRRSKITDYLKAGMACYRQKDYGSAINYFMIVSQNSAIMEEEEDKREGNAGVCNKDYLHADTLVSLDHREVYKKLESRIDLFIDRPHAYVCMAEAGFAISQFLACYQRNKDSLEERLRDAIDKLQLLVEEACEISSTALEQSCFRKAYAKSTVTVTTTTSFVTTTTIDPLTNDETTDTKTIAPIFNKVTVDDEKVRKEQLSVELKVRESIDEKLFLFLTFLFNSYECLAELLNDKKDDPASADAVAVSAILVCDRFINHFNTELTAQKERERIEAANSPAETREAKTKASNLPAHSRESGDIMRRKATFLLRRGTYFNDTRIFTNDKPEAIEEACRLLRASADIFSALQEWHRSFVVYQNCAYAYQSRGRIRPFFYMNDEDLKITAYIADEASKAWLRSVDEGTKVLEDNFTKLFKLDSASANRLLPSPHEQQRLLNNTGEYLEDYRSQYDSIRTYRLCIASSCLMAGVCSLHCNYHEAKSYLERGLKIIKKYEEQDALYLIYNAPNTGGELSPEGLCSDNTFDTTKNYVDCLDELKGSCYYHLSFCFLKLKKQQKAIDEITKAIDIFKRIYAEDVHANHKLFVSHVLQTFLYIDTKKFDEAEQIIVYLEKEFMAALEGKKDGKGEGGEEAKEDDEIVFSLRSKKLDNKTTPEVYATELLKLREVLDRYKSEFSRPTMATHIDRMTSTTVPWRRLWHFHMLLVHMAVCEKKAEDWMTFALFTLVALFVWFHSWHSKQHAQYLYDAQGAPYTKLPNDNLRAHFPDLHFPQFDERQMPLYEHSGE